MTERQTLQGRWGLFSAAYDMSQGRPPGIILESAINLSSQHISAEEYQKTESLHYWKTGVNPGIQMHVKEFQSKAQTNMMLRETSVKVTLSAESINKSALTKKDPVQDDELIDDLNIRILRALIERLTGIKLRFIGTSILNLEKTNTRRCI